MNRALIIVAIVFFILAAIAAFGALGLNPLGLIAIGLACWAGASVA